MAAALGSKNVRLETLVFSDGSNYRGQVLGSGEEKAARPHGYGELRTEQGFVMTGFFKDGKACGPGIFTAPNSDEFYGRWNAEHKREGKGLFFRAADGSCVTDQYENGRLLKRVKRRPRKRAILEWIAPASLTSSDPPCARWGHSLVYADGMAILFGGRSLDKENREVALNDLHVLDVSSGQWLHPTPAGTPPPPMHDHTATMVGHLMYVIGGQSGIEVHSSVYCFDTKRGEWSCPISKGVNVSAHSATLVDDRIVVILQGSVFALDLHDMTWQELKTDVSALMRNRVQPPAYGHSAVAVDNKVLVFGGALPKAVRSASGAVAWERCSNRLLVLDMDALRWEVPEVHGTEETTEKDYSGMVWKGSWSTPRVHHTAVLVGKHMYVIGGSTAASPEVNEVDQCPLGDVQRLDTSTFAWTSTNLPFPLFRPRAQHTAVHIPEGDVLGKAISPCVLVFGGVSPANLGMNRVEVLRLGPVLKGVRAKKKPTAIEAQPEEEKGVVVPPPVVEESKAEPKRRERKHWGDGGERVGRKGGLLKALGEEDEEEQDILSMFSKQAGAEED